MEQFSQLCQLHENVISLTPQSIKAQLGAGLPVAATGASESCTDQSQLGEHTQAGMPQLPLFSLPWELVQRI